MTKKSFRLSASGLKNIVLSSNTEFNSSSNSSEGDIFKFIFEDQEVKLNRIYAEFISPIVSHIHHSDPTIDSIVIERLHDGMLSSEAIESFKQISVGNSIEIDEKTSQELRNLSILIGNEEIFDRMNDLYPVALEEEKICEIIENLKYFENFKKNNKKDLYFQFLNDDKIIDFIASHFYCEDKSLACLAKPVLHRIISSSQLKVSSEDSLFEFINDIFSKEGDEEEEELTKIHFYEELELAELSDEKLSEFVDEVDPSEMTGTIWMKVKDVIKRRNDKKVSDIQLMNRYFRQNDHKERLKEMTIEYDVKSNDGFKGVIFHLGNGNGINSVKDGKIDIKASSASSGSLNNVVDFDNKSASFNTRSEQDSWILYDFKERKLKPSQYSIMSDHWNLSGSGYHRPQTWIIEGSNDEKEWTTLDSRQNEKSLDSLNVSKTFEIQNKNNEYYRYIRIHQTGPNTGGSYDLRFSSLEYFGVLLEP